MQHMILHPRTPKITGSSMKFEINRGNELIRRGEREYRVQLNILYRRSPKFVPWRRRTCLRNTKPSLFLDPFVKIGKHADSAKKIVERATSPPGHRCFYTRRDSQGRLPLAPFERGSRSAPRDICVSTEEN